jgi:hypothetical protein
MAALVQLTALVPDGTAGAAYLYRILTEHKNVDGVTRWLLDCRTDYTLFVGDGAWHGIPEGSMALDLADVSRAEAIEIAQFIKAMNKQETVLILEIPVVAIIV